MNESVMCPECKQIINVDSEDWPAHDGDSEQFECPRCEKTFMLELSVFYELNGKKSPCLNNESDHEYGRFPFETTGNFEGPDKKRFSKFKISTCKICGFEKKEWLEPLD